MQCNHPLDHAPPPWACNKMKWSIVCILFLAGHMAGAQMTLQSTSLRPQLLGTPLRLGAQPATLAEASSSSGRPGLTVRAAGWKWDRLLGGRGLVREDVLKDSTKAKEVLWGQPAKEKSAEDKGKLEVPEGAVGEGFDKELAGLTGGFPGGETVGAQSRNWHT